MDISGADMFNLCGIAPMLRCKLPVDVVIQLSERLPGEIETTLYRIVQETLTNIARHAQAKSASLLVEKHGGTVRAIVEDDGVGFDVNANRGERHLGLLGMRERAELLNGTLTIESSPEQGTSVFIEIPLSLVERDNISLYKEKQS